MRCFWVGAKLYISEIFKFNEKCMKKLFIHMLTSDLKKILEEVAVDSVTLPRVNRNRCQFCRLQKCLALGMSRDGESFILLITLSSGYSLFHSPFYSFIPSPGYLLVYSPGYSLIHLLVILSLILILINSLIFDVIDSLFSWLVTNFVFS